MCEGYALTAWVHSFEQKPVTVKSGVPGGTIRLGETGAPNANRPARCLGGTLVYEKRIPELSTTPIRKQLIKCDFGLNI